MIGFEVIAAEGEQKASGALKAAADVIQQSPNALQVISKPSPKYPILALFTRFPTANKRFIFTDNLFKRSYLARIKI